MKYLSIIPAVAILISCQGVANKSDSKAANSTKTETSVIGGDKDKHGCLTSAGYTWSEVRKDCIRLFESGIRMNPVADSSEYVTSGFIIFANDSSAVELYLPSEKSSEILTKTGKEYEGPDQLYILSQINSKWTLKKNHEVIFEEKCHKLSASKQ
ncbi:MAG: hypothetical protein ACRCZQ_02360 [Bacteroidales bacterium]